MAREGLMSDVGFHGFDVNFDMICEKCVHNKLEFQDGVTWAECELVGCEFKKIED